MVVGAHLLYRSDLDSHGFAMLDELRYQLQAESVLIQEGTLLAHRDLWVPEPEPAPGIYPQLSPEEQQVSAGLRTGGSPKREQERIRWEFAIQRLVSRLTNAASVASGLNS